MAHAVPGHVAMMKHEKEGDDHAPSAKKPPVVTSMFTFVSAAEGDSWSPARLQCQRILRSTACDVALSLLIGFSFILVIIEADHKDNPPYWTTVANGVLLVIYIIEAAIRIFVQRRMYFCSLMNLVDFFIVVSDIVSEMIGLLQLGEIPSLVPLRVFRLLRLTRSVKVMVKFPQLALLVKGLANAIEAVIYGVILLSMLTLFWSICAVHFIHPVNLRVNHGDCDRCSRAFETVFQSSLTFAQQVIAGDSWGTVTIPIIEESPVTAVFFAAVFLSINLTLLNVLLAVIVDNALKSSESDASIVKQKDDDRKNVQKRLRDLFMDLDRSGTGQLSQEDVAKGYEESELFRNMLSKMDIKPEDMGLIFSILDTDQSGSVESDEFVTELFNLQDRDSHTLLVFIMHYVSQLRKEMLEKRRNERESRMHSRRTSFTEQGSAPGCQIGIPPVVMVEEKRLSEKQHTEKAVTAQPAVAALQPPFWEELKHLREVISQDLVCTMREISHKSESHTRLLASIAGDTALLRGGSGSGPAVVPLQLPAGDAAQVGLGSPGPRRPGYSDGQDLLHEAEQNGKAAPLPSAWGLRKANAVQSQEPSSAAYLTLQNLVVDEPKTCPS